MSDAIRRAQTVKKIVADLALPKWQRLTQALGAFSGLCLPNEDSDARAAFEEELVVVNEILLKWNFQTVDEYSQISETDARKAIDALEAAVSHLLDSELDRIVRQLDGEDEEKRLQAIEDAREHREIVLPRLIQEFRSKLQAASEPGADAGNLPLLALLLFSEFNAQRALPAILEAIALPKTTLDAVFGDRLLYYLQSILAQFLGDQTDRIDELAANTDLHASVRAVARSAYINLVRDGRMPRVEVVKRLGNLLRLAIAERNVELVTMSVYDLARLAAVECRDVIDDAFQAQLVDVLFCNRELIQSYVDGGDDMVQRTLKACPPTGVKSLNEEYASWEVRRQKLDKLEAETSRRSSSKQATRSPVIAPPPRRQALTERAIDPSLLGNRLASHPRIGRNDPCPCGSGKKFKKCCGS